MLNPVIEKESVLRFMSWLQTYEKFVIVAHTHPDGDAIGSSLAMCHYLRSVGKKAWVIMPTIFPDFLKWMPGAERIMPYTRYREVADKIMDEAQVICCFDFNQLSRIDALGEKVAASPAKKLLLDHHLDPGDFADITISHPDQSSTCELLYRFLCDLGHYHRMNALQATCLYTGMMTDTGAFTYNSNNPEIFYIVGQLLKKGADKDLIYRRVNYNYSASRLFLQGQVLSHMQLLPELHTAIITLSREEQRQFSYIKGDSEGFVNMPLQIKNVIFSCFLRDDTEKDAVRVSLRSIGEFPCNEVAAQFGGGGHKNASGGEMAGVDIEQATERLKQVLETFKPQLEACYNQRPK